MTSPDPHAAQTAVPRVRRTALAAAVHELRLLFIALQFFTRVPIPRWVGFEPDWLHQSARHFPAIGIVVGAVAAAVLWSAEHALAQPIAVLLSMAATLLLTGGFHEDGWADTCDGLGGAVSRERALEIMKDSRIGAYGAMGLFTMLALKATILASMSVGWACGALLLGHAASRAASTVLIWKLPYAGTLEHAKAKPLAMRLSGVGCLVACAWPLALATVLVVLRPDWLLPVVVGLLATALGAAGCSRWFRRRLGGVTGDTLGAAQQATELLMLLAWAAAWKGLHGG